MNRKLFAIGLCVFGFSPVLKAQNFSIAFNPLHMLTVKPNIYLEKYLGEKDALVLMSVYNINQSEKNGYWLEFGYRRYRKTNAKGLFYGIQGKYVNNTMPSYKNFTYCSGNDCVDYIEKDVYYIKSLLAGGTIGYRFKLGERMNISGSFGASIPLKLDDEYILDESHPQYHRSGTTRAETEKNNIAITKAFNRISTITSTEVTLGWSF